VFIFIKFLRKRKWRWERRQL